MLAIDPDAKDAYVALGASNYVIGCLPGYKRAFLWFGGVHGDRLRGMEQMQLAADDGHYLQPFAKVMLALAYEREHQKDRARVLLAELAVQFPTNAAFRPRTCSCSISQQTVLQALTAFSVQLFLYHFTRTR